MEAPVEDRTLSTQEAHLFIIPFDYKMEVIGTVKMNVLIFYEYDAIAKIEFIRGLKWFKLKRFYLSSLK